MSDPFDIDEILAKATSSEQKPKEENPTKSLLNAQVSPAKEGAQGDPSRIVRPAGFKIDPRDSHITGVDPLRKDTKAVTVDPTNFTDQVAVNDEKAKKRKYYIAFGAFIFIAVLGTVIYNSLPLENNTLAQPRPQISNTAEAPFLNILPDAPVPPTDVAITARSDETGVWISNSTSKTYHLTFAGMEFDTTKKTLVKNDEFALVATSQTEGEWNGTQIYLFKDMVRSQIFAQAWDRSQLDVEGAAAAGVMYLELAGQIHAVVAIVNPDSTGFLIVLPPNLNYETAANLENYTRVE